MNHTKILKRAWEITWRYRALWVFGIILALTTGGGRGNGGGGSGGNGGNGDPNGVLPPFEGIRMPEIPPGLVATLIAIGVGLACVIVFLIIASIVARYLAETALIRMVDDYEETGEKRSVREGFRLGWSRTSFRLLLIDLVIGIPTMIAIIVLILLPIGLIVAAAFSFERIGIVTGVLLIVAGVGLFFLVILLTIIACAAISLLMQFFRRACALEKLGVVESLRQGFAIVKRHLLWDVAIMWIIMVGIGLAWAIVMIPIILLLLVLGLVMGGLPALLVGGLASLALGGATPWILAGAVGVPIFILTLVIPGLFLGGLAEVFKSSVWTLTYRELRALEGLEPGEPPELDAPDLE